tara:strand:+ start:194 stop:1171 length:978 start_codon:yes stop_codon:yes gene_type:complete
MFNLQASTYTESAFKSLTKEITMPKRKHESGSGNMPHRYTSETSIWQALLGQLDQVGFERTLENIHETEQQNLMVGFFANLGIKVLELLQDIKHNNSQNEDLDPQLLLNVQQLRTIFEASFAIFNPVKQAEEASEEKDSSEITSFHPMITAPEAHNFLNNILQNNNAILTANETSTLSIYSLCLTTAKFFAYKTKELLENDTETIHQTRQDQSIVIPSYDKPHSCPALSETDIYATIGYLSDFYDQKLYLNTKPVCWPTIKDLLIEYPSKKAKINTTKANDTSQTNTENQTFTSLYNGFLSFFGWNNRSDYQTDDTHTSKAAKRL